MRKSFFEAIKAEGRISEAVMDIACNARRYFVGVPENLDPEVKFPLFFIYRQMPAIFRIASLFKKLSK